ncbi:MAG: hypothetical protein ACO1N4_02210 [Pedobacter sp.]
MAHHPPALRIKNKISIPVYFSPSQLPCQCRPLACHENIDFHNYAIAALFPVPYPTSCPGAGRSLRFFLVVFQLVVRYGAIKNAVYVAQGIFFPIFALRFGGRGDWMKSYNKRERKKFYFFLGGWKSFSTFALRFGGRGRGFEREKRGRGEDEEEEKQIKNISFFICGRGKVSYLCSPKRNGSYQTEFGSEDKKIETTECQARAEH